MQFLHGFRSGERINGQAAGGQIGRVGDGEVELSLVEEEEDIAIHTSVRNPVHFYNAVIKITNEWLYHPHEGLFVFFSLLNGVSTHLMRDFTLLL